MFYGWHVFRGSVCRCTLPTTSRSNKFGSTLLLLKWWIMSDMVGKTIPSPCHIGQIEPGWKLRMGIGHTLFMRSMLHLRLMVCNHKSWSICKWMNSLTWFLWTCYAGPRAAHISQDAWFVTMSLLHSAIRNKELYYFPNDVRLQTLSLHSASGAQHAASRLGCGFGR